MRVLFIASDAFPSDQRADDGATLAKVLRRADHSVDRMSPLYGNIDLRRHGLARRLTKLEFELGDRSWSCELYTGRSPDGVGLVFIGNEEVLQSAESLAGDAGPLSAARVGVFAAAIVEYLKQHASDYDVVHAHGWVGAAVLPQLRAALPELPTVLTVYDAAQQGRFERADAKWLCLGEQGEDGDHVNALKAGLLVADRVTTLSPNYAHRLQREGEGQELGAIFRDIHGKLDGIRHGIDPAHWNPATDAHIPARFDPYDLEGKEKCKAELQRALALPVRSDVPLIGAIGNTEGDGLDRLAEIGSDLLRNEVQLVVQIDGGGEMVATYEELWDQWPDRIQIKTGHDVVFRHQLIAASDFLVVPGRDAPTQNIQMLAQRYGALPIVHREGGLADEVVDCEPSLKTGSGLLFDAPTPEALLSATQRAVAGFANRKPFQALQSRIMRIDHSWERAVRLYERAYRDAEAAHH